MSDLFGNHIVGFPTRRLICLLISFQDNCNWTLNIDCEIMSWASQNPEDWQLGGKCEAYMWGYERHGQLCEGGRVVLTPKNVGSYSVAQQVIGI